MTSTPVVACPIHERLVRATLDATHEPHGPQWRALEDAADCPDCRFLVDVFSNCIAVNEPAGTVFELPAVPHNNVAPRWIQARLPEIFDDTQESPVDPLLLGALRTECSVVMPNWTLATRVWEFGKLESCARPMRERLVQLVANRAYDTIKESLPEKNILIVCFGKPVHRCGKRLAAQLVESGRDVHVAMADNYFHPRIWCGRGELVDRHVVIFVDVVHSGRLLRNLWDTCWQAAPRAVQPLAIIDQASSELDTPLVALWRERA